jgi:microcystin-dependent protein
MSDPVILHATQHDNINDEVEAIETELGTNPKGAAANVGARIAAVEATAAAAGVPQGSMFPHAGINAPAGYAFCYGQTLTRSGNAALMALLTVTYTAGVTNASTNVTGTFPATTTLNLVGMPVSGTNIQAGTTITAQTTSTLTLSLAATGTASISLLVAPWGVGDGSTTFNLPDMRGRNAVGRDDMGGTDAARISTANRIGATAGAEANTLAVANLPAHNHTIDHGHADTIAVDAYSGNSGNDSPDHTHIVPDHGHYSYTYGGAGAHAHIMNVADVSKTGSGTFAKGYSAGNTATDAGGGHEHGVGTAGAGNIATWGVYDNRHQHTINHTHTKSGGVTALTGGTSGTTAAATAFNSLNPHAITNWIIKL